ncbi:UDP-N-acetylmuramoyl-L-alanine--D-glutamate ligase [Helicobacter cetorum]|uniref:UDP-N-acetylmuramoylalanine--D-glutamate ligase n=1 Tax=Helicobacter cetorum (strain ATCC BAA-540 / CCUG 52418 / MIT 99-5656) TaxID=1163745 RepID=I0EQX6_HELCM|nr:UDP-N-acetylmuramoyl-L-alanine--D-glutamate ligase [Helicobacter cetorum]AFI05345.1 UDP-N-acetylmuramoyl-L-alanyl-D-glutamate synthetase [Helicobacter cetorum MIT 99-5656]
MKISLFGHAKTTLALARFFKEQHHEVQFFDDKFTASCKDNENFLCYPSSEFNPNASELEIVSPGISFMHALVKKAKHLVSEYDFVYSLFNHHFTPTTISISGTNGKTTTTEMLTMLLEDFKAMSGGNIGVPLMELFKQQVPLWVLETSSFSLHYTNKAYPLIYLLINVESDHLTWHQNFENYLNAKLKPLTFMPKTSLAILPSKFKEQTIVQKSQVQKIFFNTSKDILENLEIPFNALPFKGAFLLDASLALLAYEQFLKMKNLKWQDYKDNALKRLSTFKIGLHKMEEFRDKEGRLWVDDSKATNIDATLQALKTFKNQKIHLIVGGDTKGVDLIPLFKELQNYEVSLYAIGSSTINMQSLALDFNIICKTCFELEKAVEEIKSVLKMGEVGLLSPSSASLDQFSSYKERGEKFKKYVLED